MVLNKRTENKLQYMAVTVLLFHFQFGFGRFFTANHGFGIFPGFGFYVKYGSSKPLTANVITLSENRANLGLYSLYVQSLVNGS